MLKDPFPEPRRRTESKSDKIGGDISAGLKVRDPKARIAVLVGLLVMLLLASVFLDSYASSPAAKQTDRDVPSVQIGTDVAAKITGVPALDMSKAERLSDQGPDAKKRFPLDAASYLLYESAYTAMVWANDRNLLPLTPASAAEIRNDSRPWRFRYVTFRGQLVATNEDNFEEAYGTHEQDEIGQVHRGRVLVEGGDQMDPPLYVTFLGDVNGRILSDTDPNVVDAKTEAITEGWVRVRGIFVKNYTDADENGRDIPSMLVVATSVVRDYETKPVESLEDIPFEIIVDNPAIADTQRGRDILSRLFPKPLYRLIAFANERAGEEGRALREKEELTPRAIDDLDEGTYEKVIGQPGAFRGTYFGGLGSIALEGYFLGPSDIETNDAGVSNVFEGWIATDREKLVRFMAPERLMNRRWPENTRIRWAGFYYKSLGYPARNGTRRLAPMVVLTELEEIRPEPRDLGGELWIGIGFLVGLALLFWIVVREDRTKRDFRASRRGKRTVEA
ncbi:MAG: hypothetical protein AAGD14_11290 [Planctomycetota bacterium]